MHGAEFRQHPDLELPFILPVESWAELPLPAVICDNTHRALIIRDAPQALMYRVLLELRHTDMVDCLTFVPVTPEVKQILHDPKPLSFITQLGCAVWPKVPR